MFRGSVLGVLIDKATSHLLLESDWVTIMHICDLISQNDVEPRTVFVLIKEKLKSENPCTALYALIVLEGIIKNCGFTVCKELTTKMNCQFLYELARTTPHSKVKEKLLELIQACAFALRKNSQHGHLKELVSNLKSEGHKFPPLRESDAMFAVDCAPEWAIGDSCQRCRVQLTLINRKYNCRHCGQVFCLDCSQSKIPLPKFGIEIDVRVCDGCYAQLTMPQKPDAQKDKQEGLQLGLGFSQSEAEAKEKENIKIALHDANNAKCEMAIETMNRFTDDLLREKIFHCQICDELCTSDIFLVKGKGNVCGKCFEEKCGEEMKSRGELNTALILIISKLKLPCKFQPKGCDKRVAPKKYSKHIGRCEFKIKPCPMVNFKGCEWKGINLEVAEHIQEIHKEDVIKSDNNIFKVEASLTEPVSVKLLSDDCNNCILETLVEDNKFYYGVFKPPTKQS